jgi:uncharacterized protein
MSLPLDRRPGIVRIIPFALYLLLLALEGALPWLRDILPPLADWDWRWLYPVKAGLVAMVLLVFWRHYRELKILPTRVGDWMLAGFAGVAVFVLWINLDQDWATLGTGALGFDPRNDAGQVIWILAGLRLTGAALVVPVMEELFWRSFIQRWLDKADFLAVDPRSASLKAVMITSALFAVEHNLWFAGLLAGLAYGLLYKRTRNLWLPIFAHALTNGMLGIWVLATGNWQFW